MKKTILITLIVGILIGVGGFQLYAWQTRTYSGYTVVLNGETLEGFVYVNDAANSVLVTLYPTSNYGYVYGTNGQNILSASDVTRLMSDPRFNVTSSIIALINPIIPSNNYSNQYKTPKKWY